MSVAGSCGGGFTRDYLENGIARLKKESAKNPTPENNEAIKRAEKALEELGD